MSLDTPGRFRRVLSKLAATPPVEHPEPTPPAWAPAPCASVPVADLPARDRECCSVSGHLRTVMLRPRAGVPSLVAELADASGQSVSLVWLGRRRIPGLEPGRALTATGRVSFPDGHPVIFNPRYELLPGVAE
jgi:hypothetical protein